MSLKTLMHESRMRTGRAIAVALAIALMASIAPLVAVSGALDDEAERLIARLQASNPDFLIERMHGNASADLQALMKLRFAATHSVIAHIERLEATEPDSPLANALLHALGFVLDPASIPWLRTRLDDGDYQRLAERWLASRHYADSWIGESSWVEGKERWFEFFSDAYSGDPDPRRRRLWLAQLLGFPSAEAIAHVRRLRDRTDDPREFLIIEAALSERGLAVDWPRVASEVNRLPDDPEHTPFLIEIARKLRHELFVPILIRDYEVRHRGVSGPGAPPANYTLMLITLQRDIEGQAAWQRWWDVNSSRRRSDWIAEQQAQLDALLARDEAEAAAYFETAVYAWSDIAFLPYIEDRLLDRPAFYDSLAGWINLTYQSAYRSALARVARPLRAHANRLEDWARRLLIERDFLPPERPETWEEIVELANMRM